MIDDMIECFLCKEHPRADCEDCGGDGVVRAEGINETKAMYDQWDRGEDGE